MKFTVYETIHSYRVWKEVDAESEEAVMKIIAEGGIEALGEPDNEDVTSNEIDIYSEDKATGKE